MAFLNLIFRNLNEPLLAYSSVCINIACRNSLGLINCFVSGSLLPGYRNSWWQRTQLSIAHRLWTCTLLDCGCTSWRSHWNNTSSPCAHHLLSVAPIQHPSKREEKRQCWKFKEDCSCYFGWNKLFDWNKLWEVTRRAWPADQRGW